MNNNAECGYDGGDCRYCSCGAGLEYDCSVASYDCRDPEVLGSEVYDCLVENVVDAPCAMDIKPRWVVNDTESATASAGTVLCSRETFDVEWHGHVTASQTIKLSNATVLRSSGASPGAKVEAALDFRLLPVTNASQIFSNVEITDGKATYGGALAAADSFISFEKALFSGNRARLGGGAVYVILNSLIVCGEGTFFYGNHAGDVGGAMYVAETRE